MSPLISIIIASFNSGKVIGDALESVLQQSFQDWECIIVDGASKDNTVGIIEEFEKKDSRFRHISEPDKGIYDAFNKGWKMAKGEWIYYLGSDDTLTKESFTSLVKNICEDFDIITGDVWIKKIDGSLKPNYSLGFGGCHQGKIVRKTIIEKMNGFDEQYRILADLDMMCRMKNESLKVLNVRSFVAYFVMDGASQSLKGEWNRYLERVNIYRQNHVSNYPEVKCFFIHARNMLSVIYRKVIKLFKNENQ